MPLTLVTDPIPLRIDSDGVTRVGRTRVTLDTVVLAFLEGCTAEEIMEQYPSLQLSDIYSVIGYYLRHQASVDAYLRERERQAIEVRQEVEKRFSPMGIRDRLLARRVPQGQCQESLKSAVELQLVWRSKRFCDWTNAV